MNELTRDQVARRQAEFPSMIRELAWNNPTVYHMVELYSQGRLITKEEAYCQMVRELATTYDQMMKRITDEAHMKMSTFILTQPNE